MQKFHTRVHSASLIVLVAGTAALTACDQRTDATKSVQAASQSLHAVGVAPGTGSNKYEAKLKEIAGSLSEAASNGTEGEKAAAAVLLTQTVMGQGELASLTAKNAELAVRNRVTLINGLVASWSRHKSMAVAAESFDPSKEIATLTAAQAMVQSELKQQEAALAAAKASQAKFAAEAKAKMDEASAAATQYATLTQSTVSMSATKAAEVVQKANEFRRKADDLRTQGGKLQAQADLLEPTVNEYSVLADKCRKQIKNFQESVKGLEARLATARDEAKQASDAATVAANDLDKLVAEALDARVKEVVPAYVAAIDLFGKAASKSAGSKAAAPGVGSVAVGSAKLSIGETNWAKAQGARSLAATLDTLASIKPALPNAADYKTKAGEAREEAKQAVDAASAALDEAKAAFESARITDKAVKERLTKLGEQLAKAKDVAAGAEIIPPPAAEPAAPADSGKSEAAPAAGAASVDPALIAAAEKVLAATRDFQSASLVETAAGVDGDAMATIKQMCEFQDSMGSVDKACRAKFQKSMAEVLASNPMMGGMMKGMSAGGASAIKAADLKFTVEGDTATASGEGMPRPVHFAKKDGAWVLDLSSEAAMAPMLKAQLGMLTQMGAVMQAWGKDIEAGTYADASAASSGLMQKLMPMMQQMMGGGGPGRRNGNGGGGG
jgi:hypothetical protein